MRTSWMVLFLLIPVLCHAQMWPLPPDATNQIPPQVQLPKVDKKIDLVMVGFDIDKNPKAQKMLQDVAEATRKTGANAKVILAGKDPSALDDAFSDAMNSATGLSTPVVPPVAPPPPPPPPPVQMTLTVKAPVVGAGEVIEVVHADVPVTDPNAWIGFYRAPGDKPQDYISYTFLRNLTGRTYDVEAPDEPGKGYHFRVFMSQGYDVSATSAAIEVK